MVLQLARKITSHLYKLKFHYGFHKTQPLDPVMRHFNPVHSLTQLFLLD